MNLKDGNSEKNKFSVKKYVPAFIGILFLMIALCIALLKECPNNATYICIYALIGCGISLLFKKSASESKANLTIHDIKIGLGGAVVLPFILIISNPIKSMLPNHCDFIASTLIVNVRGKKGENDLPLIKKGSVEMKSLKGGVKEAEINQYGQAMFPETYIKDSFHLNIKFSEDYQSINPDSIYVVNSVNPISLIIELQGINLVKGYVLYDNSILSGVIVELITDKKNLLDTTNGTGDFSFQIAEELQKKTYEIRVIKKGFKTKSFQSYPQTHEPLQIVMEKN